MINVCREIPAKSYKTNLCIWGNHIKTLLNGISDSSYFFSWYTRVDDVKKGDWNRLLIRKNILHRCALWCEFDRESFFRDMISIVFGESIPWGTKIAKPKFISVINYYIGIDDRATTTVKCRVLNNHKIFNILQRCCKYLIMIEIYYNILLL